MLHRSLWKTHGTFWRWGISAVKYEFNWLAYRLTALSSVSHTLRQFKCLQNPKPLGLEYQRMLTYQLDFVMWKGLCLRELFSFAWEKEGNAVFKKSFADPKISQVPWDDWAHGLASLNSPYSKLWKTRKRFGASLPCTWPQDTSMIPEWP